MAAGYPTGAGHCAAAGETGRHVGSAGAGDAHSAAGFGGGEVVDEAASGAGDGGGEAGGEGVGAGLGSDGGAGNVDMNECVLVDVVVGKVFGDVG